MYITSTDFIALSLLLEFGLAYRIFEAKEMGTQAKGTGT
jgi:hypothetical protein